MNIIFHFSPTTPRILDTGPFMFFKHCWTCVSPLLLNEKHWKKITISFKMEIWYLYCSYRSVTSIRTSSQTHRASYHLVPHLCGRSWCWLAGSRHWGRRCRWCRSQSRGGSSCRRRAPRRRRWPGTWSRRWRYPHTELRRLYWGPLGREGEEGEEGEEEEEGERQKTERKIVF